MNSENGDVRGYEVYTLVCSLCIVVHIDVATQFELTSLTTEIPKGTETLVGNRHMFIPTIRDNPMKLFSSLFLKRLSLSRNQSCSSPSTYTDLA